MKNTYLDYFCQLLMLVMNIIYTSLGFENFLEYISSWSSVSCFKEHFGLVVRMSVSGYRG